MLLYLTIIATTIINNWDARPRMLLIVCNSFLDQVATGVKIHPDNTQHLLLVNHQHANNNKKAVSVRPCYTYCGAGNS